MAPLFTKSGSWRLHREKGRINFMIMGDLVDGRILKFIARHHVLTLATCDGGAPWCSHMFYVYMVSENRFVFSSDLGTRHACEAAVNCRVAGSVVLESRVVGRLQGLQLEGVMRRAEDDGVPGGAARAAYLKRFPYALPMDLTLWTLEPVVMKFTDNTLGFGKKLLWRREG